MTDERDMWQAARAALGRGNHYTFDRDTLSAAIDAGERLTAERERALADEQLRAIAERAEKATPLPWTQDGWAVVAEVPTGRPGGEVIIQCKPTIARRILSAAQEQANAAFIAHAREDIPALLTAVGRLTAALAAQADELAAAKLECHELRARNASLRRQVYTHRQAYCEETHGATWETCPNEGCKAIREKYGA